MDTLPTPDNPKWSVEPTDAFALLCDDCSKMFHNSKGKWVVFPNGIEKGYIPLSRSHWHRTLAVVRQDGTSPIEDCRFCSFMAALDGSEKLGKGEPYPRAFLATTGWYNPSPEADHVSKHYVISYQASKFDRIDKESAVLFRADDPRVQIIQPLSPMSTSTESPMSFDCLSIWITNCEENHGTCQKLRERRSIDAEWLPRRLVYLGDIVGDSPLSARILETATDQLPSDRRYASLSYCWGPSPDFRKLKVDLIQSFRAGWGVETLCQTFKDAFVATARLGLRLIWIDALCIIQDSETDWEAESTTMANVYSYAFVNLAAAASFNADGGLFRKRKPAATNPAKLRINWPGHVVGDYICTHLHPWVSRVAFSPLLRRAWVFQERLLSSRTVYFSYDQLFWECGELYASEVFPHGGPWDLEYGDLWVPMPYYRSRRPNSVVSKRIKHQYARMRSRTAGQGDSTHDPHFIHVWSQIVSHYSGCNLTYAKDRLVAISGVARQLLGSNLADIYHAGLWGGNLPLFLLWYSAGIRVHLQPDLQLAPSWSWASTENAIMYEFTVFQHADPDICIEVLDILVPSGVLTVRGQLCEAILEKPSRRIRIGPLSLKFYKDLFRHSYLNSWIMIENVRSGMLFPEHGLRADCRDVCLDRVPVLRSSVQAVCLRVASAKTYSEGIQARRDAGLILVPTGRTRGEFLRVGSFEIAGELLTRSWRADPQFFNTRLRRRKGLDASLFKGGRIGSELYKDYDGEDKYTIMII